MSTELLQAILENRPLEFKKLFEQHMAEKASEALAEHIEEVDLNPINEISKSTLASYIKKGNVDKTTHGVSLGSLMGRAESDSDKNKLQKSARKLFNRTSGINKAVDKLTKESTDDEDDEINEVSKSTLASYIKKAAADNLGRTDVLWAMKGSHLDRHGDHPEKIQVIKKIFSRQKGLNKAVDKLTKESIDDGDDEINEVSKSTLASYLKKASRDNVSRTIVLGSLKGITKPEKAEVMNKIASRQLGINKAIDKLTKESTDDEDGEINEVSKQLLRRYIEKANNDQAERDNDIEDAQSSFVDNSVKSNQWKKVADKLQAKSYTRDKYIDKAVNMILKKK